MKSGPTRIFTVRVFLKNVFLPRPLIINGLLVDVFSKLRPWDVLVAAVLCKMAKVERVNVVFFVAEMRQILGDFSKKIPDWKTFREVTAIINQAPAQDMTGQHYRNPDDEKLIQHLPRQSKDRISLTEVL